MFILLPSFLFFMPLKDELNGYLRLPRTFFGIKGPESGNPDVGIVGIPYDITSSYTPGARFGPDAIRKATDGERSHSYPLTIGEGYVPEEPLSKLITLEDVGDLEVVQRLPEAAVVDISEAVTKLATKESSLLFLGGDHFITYPILRGLKRERKGKWGILYLDAHADLYSDMGGYQLSHATTLRRIIDEKIIEIDDVIAFDWTFFALCLHAGAKAIFTNNTQTYYRQHGNNIASPCAFSEEQILRGVRVKRDHYDFLSKHYDGYINLSKKFESLYSRLQSDVLLKEDYYKAIRMNATDVSIWWEPIKTLEELGL